MLICCSYVFSHMICKFFLRELCNLIRSRWINISWGFPSWIVYMYCICLCLVAEAHDDQLSSVYYACENVQNYYAGVQHLRGDKLKKKLNIIISEHQSLPYTKVIVFMVQSLQVMLQLRIIYFFNSEVLEQISRSGMLSRFWMLLM